MLAGIIREHLIKMPADYSFGGFVLKPDLGTLELEGRSIILRAKSFSLLCHFAANAGRVIPKTELVDAVWGGLAISDDAITQTVRDVRKALGDGEGRLIRTVPKRGYVFLPEGAAAARGASVLRGAKLRAPEEDPIARLRAHISESWSDTPHLSLMGEMADDGRSACGDGTSASRRSRAAVVVLPLNVVGGPVNPARASNWADGLVRDATRQLARLRSFFVLSAASSQAVAQGGVTGSDAAKLLQADYYCTGTLEVDDGVFHVEVELVKTQDGRLLWSERWSEPWREASRAGSELADQIVREIALHVEITERDLTLGKQLHALSGWEKLHRG
ncbi:winged helix-turn-helix domain-containing protein, partial [Nostoc sp. NIES-2111]